MTAQGRRYWLWGVGLVFTLLVALFFYQRYWIEESTWRWIIALPTLTLTVHALRFSRTGGILVPAALLASAAGDYYGSEGIFLLQVAFFAVAHLFYIADFLPHRKANRGKKVATGVFGVVVASYVSYIILNIPFGVNSVAIALYGVIIATMGLTAILQRRKYYGWYVVAALLFVFSDSVIAYGFVGEVPYSGLWIMTTYYAAQTIFATLATQRTR